MPRLARIVIPGLPHHVAQRANPGQQLFFTDRDRRVYLELLAAQSKRFGLRVAAYCLMPDHVHLVAIPPTGGALARAVGRTHALYARHLNRQQPRRVRCWPRRFRSCALGDRYLTVAACHIERNPVRAGMVRAPWRYRWSSAAAHIGLAKEAGLLDLAALHRHCTPHLWKHTLRKGVLQDDVAALRRHTRRGWPLVSDQVLSDLEARLGRRLRPLPVGRPRKRKPGPLGPTGRRPFPF